jgi:hypothetical protein
MKRVMKMTLALGASTVLLSLLCVHIMCRDGSPPTQSGQDANTLRTETLTTTSSATTLPAGPTSVRISIMMVVHKNYGVLARIMGKKNATITDEPFDVAKSWWDNPMVIFRDTSFPNSQVTAQADSRTITGRGQSSNVGVEMTLVPHADITLNTAVACDCLKGTITANISTISDFYDGKWIQVANVKDSQVAFSFDTSDKSRPAEPTGTETRSVPPFSFERYVRDQEKWEPRTAWPAKPKSGDWRTAIYVKDAKLVITGYRYTDGAGSRPTSSPPQRSSETSPSSP